MAAAAAVNPRFLRMFRDCQLRAYRPRSRTRYVVVVGDAALEIALREQKLRARIEDEIVIPLLKQNNGAIRKVVITYMNLIAVADGRQIPVARVTPAPAVLPTRRFAIVSTPMRSRTHVAQAQVVRGVLSGMMRSVFRSAPGAHRGRRIRSCPTRGVVLFTEAESPLDGDFRAVMLQALQAAHVPLHVVIFGHGGKGRGEAEAMARDSGGRHVVVAGSDVAGVRTVFAQSIAGEGVYFVALEGRYRRVTVALRHGAGVVK